MNAIHPVDIKRSPEIIELLPLARSDFLVAE